MADKPAMLGATAFKPVERHGMEAISWFLYDKNTGAIMGRTCKSWALITIFYLIYYSCLAGFWAICMVVFLTTINDHHPKWIGKESRIGVSPGIGVRPAQDWAHMDSGIFSWNHEQKGTIEGLEGYEDWSKRTQKFLEDSYPECNPDKNCIKKDKAMTRPSLEFYPFDINELGPCKGNGFGFKEGKPCILLKLNKIYGVKHEYFHNSTQAEAKLKEKIPKSLADHIDTNIDGEHVWVDCHGENAMDKERLPAEEVKYYPQTRGFSSMYYPYENAPGYQSPLVAVQFNNLNKGVLYHIECRAYAGNIGYDRNDRVGKAHFEIIVHDDKTANCVKGNDKCTKNTNKDFSTCHGSTCPRAWIPMKDAK